MSPKVQHPLARSNRQSTGQKRTDKSQTGSSSKAYRPSKPPPAIPLGHIDEDGNTGLHRAVLQKQYDYIPGAAQYAGIYNNAQKTALHLAVENGDFIAIQSLLEFPGEAGVRVKTSVKYKGYTLWKPTALMILALLNHDSQAVKAEDGSVQLHKVLETLISIEGGKQDFSGYTALMYACISNNILLAEQLIPVEAGIQAKGGWTALMLASQFGSLFIASKLYLKEYGLQNAGGWTALMDAATNGHVEIAQLLAIKERGMRTKKGRTALMQAVRGGYYEISTLLLRESGYEDNSGYSALMYAVELGYLDLVRLLGPFEKEHYSRKALQLLKDGTSPEVVKRYTEAMHSSLPMAF